MLKAMRKHAKFFYVFFVIIILSFILWGVGTVDKSTTVPVVEIEKQKISLEDYWAAYDRTRQYYRELLKDKFTDETEKQLNLKQKVLDSLIDEQVLLIAARRAGIKITDEELQAAITNDPFFLRDGKFSRDIYIRTLELNRMTPESFESMKRRELTIAKMRQLIGESVEVTKLDIPQVSGNEQAMNTLRQTALSELRETAIQSYLDGLKKQMKIKINQQLIG
ncbi:MAG: SurA N-terminal domain-containing protein [Thermodesulfovibrionales bacterium]|jgi:peptidyl-prolyl cis-trans isomerase D